MAAGRALALVCPGVPLDGGYGQVAAKRISPLPREPGGDLAFVPLDSPEVWIVQGDPTVYTSQPSAP